MEVSVVSRTDSEHRILESVHLDKAEAEEARQGIIKRYKNAPRLCTDTETDTFTVDVWVATKVKATKDGHAPETTVLAVGSQLKCSNAAALEVASLERFVNGDVEGDADHGWTATDDDTGAIYTVQLHHGTANPLITIGG